MTLTQLEYFCAVCRYHSITRAAETLFVSQPTISTSIRDLENEFHIKLFNHGKNRITLTKDGEKFYKKAEDILKQTHDLYDEYSDSNENVHPLRIGIPPMISVVFFPRLKEEFEKKYNIPIQLLEYGSIRARNLVDSEQIDLAIANLDFYNLDKYNHHVLLKNRYVYCVSKKHRYAKKKKITIDMLRDERIVLFNTDSVQNQTITSLFRSANIMPNISMYCSQTSTILNCIEDGKSGAFFFDALEADEDKFVKIPISPEISTIHGVIWKKGIFIPDRLNKFIGFVKKYELFW